MNVILSIVCIIIMIASTTVLYHYSKKQFMAIICIAVIYDCSLSLMLLCPHDNPTAIDVYAGRTELKITSINGVPTDSIVVFKEKAK